MVKAKRAKQVKSSQEADQNWLVRCPGGPLKLIKSNRVMTEDAVKEIYLSQLKVRRTKSQDDPDAKWPYLLLTTEEQVRKNHSWVFTESLRKNQRNVITVVDGEVIEDTRVQKETKRSGTRVQISAK